MAMTSTFDRDAAKAMEKFVAEQRVERAKHERELNEKKDALIKEVGETTRNIGVEILLARMDAQPEEFRMWGTDHAPYGESKWTGFMNALTEAYSNLAQDVPPGALNAQTSLHFLPREDIIELYTKLCSIQGAAFSEAVIKQVLVADEGPEKGISLASAEQSKVLNSGAVFSEEEVRNSIELKNYALYIS